MAATATPSYRRQKRGGRLEGAFGQLNGQRLGLGRCVTPERWAEYHRIVAAWVTTPAGSSRSPCPATPRT